MKIKAIDVTRQNFEPYGTCIDLYSDPERVTHFSADAFSDHMTRAPLIDTIGHLGLTVGAAAPCEILSMEKHNHTQEAILCAAEPVVLCVASAHVGKPPQAEDVRAFIVRPGQAVVMERDVWHDACRGLGRAAAYYWIAGAGDAPAIWVKVEGRVEIEI